MHAIQKTPVVDTRSRIIGGRFLRGVRDRFHHCVAVSRTIRRRRCAIAKGFGIRCVSGRLCGTAHSKSGYDE